MPRKFLLATTAAAALLGAAGLGLAQGTHEGESGGAKASGMHSQAQGAGAQENRGQGQAGAQENRGQGQAGAQENRGQGQAGVQENRGQGQAGVEQNRGTEQRGEGNTRMQSGKSDREMGESGRNTEHNQQTGAGDKEEMQHNSQRSDENMQRNQRSDENMQRRNQRSETNGERNRERGGVNREGTGPGRAQSNEGINTRNGPGRAQSNEGMGQRSEQGQSRSESVRSVHLSNQQRTRIRDTFSHEHVQRVDHPDFALRVGTTVPRTIQVYDVPEDIVTVVPQYRGLKYIFVRDEVIFLDPDTLEIVAIMPA